MGERQSLLSGRDIQETIQRMAGEVAQMIERPEEAALVGIRTHGVTLARRLQQILAETHGWDIPLGILDTTLYRDDLGEPGEQPLVRTTELDFDLTDRLVVLLDDVLATGRTVRCALDAMTDFGRPRAVRLVAFVDRGGRELPIHPDVVGIRVDATSGEKIEVRFMESDGEDAVWIEPAVSGDPAVSGEG